MDRLLFEEDMDLQCRWLLSRDKLRKWVLTTSARKRLTLAEFKALKCERLQQPYEFYLEPGNHKSTPADPAASPAHRDESRGCKRSRRPEPADEEDSTGTSSSDPTRRILTGKRGGRKMNKRQRQPDTLAG